MIIHRWGVRAKCGAGCGYIWTNPDSFSVTCECRASSIDANVFHGLAEAVTDDTAFAQAVAGDLKVAVSDLTLEKF
jgi:hypothetical protein